MMQKWGTGKVRPEQGILKLRKELGTFGNLRPCFFASDSLVESSPLKAENVRGVNFNIIRELTGGIYFGDRKEDEGDGKAMDTEPYSVEEIERVVRLAGNLASVENPPVPVWSLDKANVLATSRLWRKTFERIMKDEYPHLKSGTHLIDSAAMLMIKNPRALNGVVVTSNLFGDIISDEASVIPGSLGLLPSASLGGIPDGKTKLNGIYEPIHGKIGRCRQTLRLLTRYRFCARYRWQGHCQSHCNHPFHEHDVQVFTMYPRACKKDRRGDKNHHRQWCTNRRYRRKVKYKRSRRRDSCGTREAAEEIIEECVSFIRKIEG
jgi:hypothetical protein